MGKSPAQILIRWSLQHNVSTIPKSTKKSRILENFKVCLKTNWLSLICQGFIQLVWREHSHLFSQFNWFWSFLWMELWVEIFSIHSFWNICEWKFFLFIVFWDSYSQVLWNSDWMQVQSMGTHCQVSSQLIKKIWIFLAEFLPQGGIEPGSPNPQTSD